MVKPLKTNAHRQGSTYIIVVGATLLITVFMMAGLLVIRIQRNQFQNASDQQQARLNAEAALDLGLNYIRVNPSNWRNQPLNLQSEYSAPNELQLAMIDPVDGDLFDSLEDPVLLVATGSAGNAIQMIRARLNLDAQGYDSLQSAIHAGNQITVVNSTVTTDKIISYDQMMSLTGSSTLQSDVLGAVSPVVGALSSISGDVTTSGDLPKDLPSRDSIDVVNLYSANAVQIDVDDLYESDHSLNRLNNVDFSNGMQDWLAVDSDVVSTAFNLQVTKRQASAAGIGQDIKSLLYKGGRFQLACKFVNQSTKDALARISIRLESTVDGVKYFSTPDFVSLPGEKTDLIGTVIPAWTGQLQSAIWIVDTIGENNAELRNIRTGHV